MVSEKNEKIFEILRSRGHISPSTQKMAIGFMERWGVDAFRALTETHLVEENKMADILAQELNLPRLPRVRIREVDKEVFDFLPYDLALELVVFPFELRSDGVLMVAFADPSNPDRVSQVREVTGRSIEVFVGERSEIISAIQRHYPLSKQLPSLVSMMRGGKGLP